MSTIISTIGSASRNYVDPVAWAAALPSNLSGNDYVGQCYNDSEFTLSATLDFGSRTNGTITLTTAAGQSFRDQSGVRTNALQYDQTKGVGINFNTNQISVGSGSTAPITFSNLQIRGLTKFQNAGTGLSIAVNDNIWLLGTNGLFTQSDVNTTWNFRRSLLIGNTQDLFFFNAGTSTLNVFGCTILVGSSLLSVGSTATATVNIENCWASAITAISTVSGTLTPTYSHNMTDLSSPPTGWTGSLTPSSQFVNYAEPVGDLRDKSGANLIGAGVQDLTNDAKDISGSTRNNPPDIGAWEFSPVPGGGGKGGSLLLFGSIGWTPSLIGVAALRAGNAIRRNDILTRRSLLIGN